MFSRLFFIMLGISGALIQGAQQNPFQPAQLPFRLTPPATGTPRPEELATSAPSSPMMHSNSSAMSDITMNAISEKLEHLTPQRTNGKRHRGIVAQTEDVISTASPMPSIPEDTEQQLPMSGTNTPVKSHVVLTPRVGSPFQRPTTPKAPRGQTRRLIQPSSEMESKQTAANMQPISLTAQVSSMLNEQSMNSSLLQESYAFMEKEVARENKKFEENLALQKANVRKNIPAEYQQAFVQQLYMPDYKAEAFAILEGKNKFTLAVGNTLHQYMVEQEKLGYPLDLTKSNEAFEKFISPHKNQLKHCLSENYSQYFKAFAYILFMPNTHKLAIQVITGKTTFTKALGDRIAKHSQDYVAMQEARDKAVADMKHRVFSYNPDNKEQLLRDLNQEDYLKMVKLQLQRELKREAAERQAAQEAQARKAKRAKEQAAKKKARKKAKSAQLNKATKSKKNENPVSNDFMYDASPVNTNPQPQQEQQRQTQAEAEARAQSYRDYYHSLYKQIGTKTITT